jgi:gamma-glutamyltranspeptidase
MWAIREMIVLKQGKKPASSTMATTMDFAATTTTIKGGTRGQSSRSTIKLEVLILTISIISLPLEIVFGQAIMNENLNKKLATNDKVLEKLNSTIESSIK